MNIYLLTHERELDRPTNTGTVAMAAASGLVQRIVWSRTNPDPLLERLATTGKLALVYPAVDSQQPSRPVGEFDHFLLLDGTWQEARKMFNRTPYLAFLPRVCLQPEASSNYQLRRNQLEGGLCTAECVVELLRAKGNLQLAEEVTARFVEFNRR
ncbi:tRNA-uridine aminocarboxypropyltransferase [Microbulbifer guangxiensis]|uniref:tRNA-uridine aminocarboxypropyltransferase n=1 Tax=Microbulbifer guangxiensis TaxID=2904249 RepID=UPI001F2F88B6|nr:tRNA-uridine aminocarboxypropyltransferase [Microbulbifer guangxiensis]